MTDFLISFGVPLGIAIAVLIAAGIFFKGIWQVASPNEALLVSGLGGGKDGRSFKIVMGAGTAVVPGFQNARRLSLVLREAILNVDCVTRQGIKVGVVGVCIYKIANDPSSITNAANRFLGQEDKMAGNIQTLFDGHLRSIVGTLTVEELITNRVALTDATRDAAKEEMNALGLQIESLQIKEIQDPTGYIENLALPHIAEVKKQARIAQAQADQEASVAEQNSKALTAKATADSQILQNGYSAAAQKAKAEADQAGPLAAAQAQQAVVLENTKLAELEADRTQKELEVTVRRPADAEAYRLETVAKGQAQAAIAQANGEATRIKVQAEADAARTKFQSEAAAAQVKVSSEADATSKQLIGTAESIAISARGNAEAEVLKSKGLAEAAGLTARAEALAKNSDAVFGQILAEKMPQIVEAAAKPIGNIKDMTVFNGLPEVNGWTNLVIANALKLLPTLKNFASVAAQVAQRDNTSPEEVDANPNGKTPVKTA